MIINAEEARRRTRKNTSHTKAIEDAIRKQNKTIQRAMEEGRHEAHFYTLPRTIENEVKKSYESKGYTFKPTGFIGGVYQLTERICW